MQRGFLSGRENVDSVRILHKIYFQIHYTALSDHITDDVKDHSRLCEILPSIKQLYIT